jgi:hypothetical protein
VWLNWYRLGYRCRFSAGDGPGSGPMFVIAPGGGVALLDYRLEIDGTGGPSTTRSFRKVTGQVGLEAVWRLTDRVSLAADVLCSIPLERTPFILAAGVTAGCRVLDREQVDMDLKLGIGYELIRYDDEHTQEVANDIEVDAGPLLLIGVEARF